MLILALTLYTSSFLGELGWEFYVANDQASALYDAIMDAGQKHGIGHIGGYAINSMRLEKGFRLWGAEVKHKEKILSTLKAHFYLGHPCLLNYFY